MSKYGLNLRPAQKKQPIKPPLATPFGFNDDDENDVEREIARQASKNKALKEVSWPSWIIVFWVFNVSMIS